MGKYAEVACVYSPVAIMFAILAYYWNNLVLLKRFDSDV